MSIRLRTFSCILLSSFLWAQDIAWQQTLGGVREEHLYDAISTYDYGVLLAGSGNVPNVLYGFGLREFERKRLI
jgi:hypothetical protein